MGVQTGMTSALRKPSKNRILTVSSGQKFLVSILNQLRRGLVRISLGKETTEPLMKNLVSLVEERMMVPVIRETMGTLENLISLVKERTMMLKLTTDSLVMEVMVIRTPTLTSLEVDSRRKMTETAMTTTISFPSEEVVNQNPKMTIHSVSFNFYVHILVKFFTICCFR